jgi:cyclophilin family peptidyl-prolyl cis-trans isomerase
VRAVLGHALETRDARQRSEAQRAGRAVFADSVAWAAFEAQHPAPAWQPAALAPYRARLAELDSTGAIGRLRGARLQTSKGAIEWRFDTREAPLTVLNFVTLARKGYYDGGTWHRVVPYFVAQDGDPSGTGSGGPGYAFRCEYNRLRYDSGAVGMALSGKDTGGSQYFITHCPQPHLDGRYTIFAHVVGGQDVVDRLRRGDKIEKVTLLDR